MAKKLNKSRLRDTNLIIVLSILITAVIRQDSIDGNDNPHEIIEFIGLVMTIIAALGRMYSTAFLGGFKNKKVIDIGPFSVCRNPLYFFLVDRCSWDFFDNRQYHCDANFTAYYLPNLPLTNSKGGSPS